MHFLFIVTIGKLPVLRMTVRKTICDSGIAYKNLPFLSAFTKIAKSDCLSVFLFLFLSFSLSVRPHRATRRPLERFSWSLIYEVSKISRDNSSFIKIKKKITATLYEALYTFMIISCWIIHRIRKILDKGLDKNRTHILLSIKACWKSCHLWDNAENYDKRQTGHRLQNRAFRNVLRDYKHL